MVQCRDMGMGWYEYCLELITSELGRHQLG